MKGSFTLEASLIFPLIALVIVTILYISIYLHDFIGLQGIAHQAALNIPTLCDTTTNYKNRLEQGLYVSGIDQEALQEQLELYVSKSVKSILIMKGNDETTVAFKETNYLVYKKIEITITKDFMTPFAFANRILGDTNLPTVEMKAHAQSKLLEPARVIRTIDFMDDLTSEIKATKRLKDQYNNILEKIKTAINKWI